MALDIADSGSQTATISTEHTLSTQSTNKNAYQLAVDVSAMANGATPDIVVIKEYSKARSGDSEQLVDQITLIGAQSQGLVRTLPTTIGQPYVRYTLTQTQGTGRAFPWAVSQVQ